MTYMTQYNQAKPSWRVKPSKTCFSNEAHGKTGWVQLRLVTPKLPAAYVSSMTIRLELLGRGLAYFDEFECRPVA
jgi:hypothetical protein